MYIPSLHKDFKLNGQSFQNVKDVLNFSESYYPDVFSFLKFWFDSKDFISVNTSGSTGKPKRISLKKEFMRNSALATGNYFNLPEKSSALLCLSSEYIAGKMMLVRSLVLGWHLDVVQVGSNPLENNKKNYDFSAMVPMQLFHSLDTISQIKKLIVGGGVVSETLKQNIQSVPTHIFATYGMTETITHIAMKRLNHFSSDENLDLNKKDIENYRVLPNIKISIDGRGCLVIDAPLVSDLSIVTNDLVEIICESEFKWLGRIDSIINSGGVKLIPEQIEKKLSKIIENRFFVSSIPDSILGEILILLIECEAYELEMDRFQSILQKYEIPKKVYFLDQFVETISKKVDRNKTKLLVKKW